MASSENITILVIIILAIILIIVIAYVLIRNSKTTVPAATGSLNLPTLNQPCLISDNKIPNIYGSTGTCSTGLICIANNTCAIQLGFACSKLNDCEPNSTSCSGLCLTGPTGTLNALCPCNNGFQCTIQPNGINLCKGANGTTCSIDSDCVAKCTNGVCSGGLPIGSPCLGNQCGDNLYCDPTNFCQPLGIISGQQNSYCNITTNPKCNNPLSCIDHTCVSTVSELGASCGGTNLACNLPLLCSLQNPVPPSTVSQYQVCVYPDNNKCTNLCAPNFTCKNNKCLAQNNQACNINTNCVNNNCSNNDTLFYWDGITWNNIGTIPTDTYNRMNVLYKTSPTDTTPSSLYMLGSTALRFYNASNNMWSIKFTNPISKGTIIDSAIDHNNNVFILVDTGTSVGRVVLDQNLNPVNNFGTPDGNLIIAGIPVPLNSIDIDINNNIISTDTSGKLYVNKTLKVNSGAKQARSFGNDTTVQNYAYNSSIGIQTVGQLNNNTFPLFDIETKTYDKITNYSIHVENSVDVPTSVSSGLSYIYMIASSDNVNFQLVSNHAAYQSVFPGYINSGSIVGTNGPDLYLYTNKMCMS